MPVTMPPKERVLTAFRHQTPDRVPIDYVTNPGIDRRLKAALNLAADDDEGLLRYLGVDFRSANAPYVGPQIYAEPPGIKVNPWGAPRRWIEHETGGYWDYVDFPLKDASLEQVEAWPMPSPDDYDYDFVAAESRRQADYCVAIGWPGVGDIINSAGMIRGMEQTLVDLISDDPACLRWIDRRIEVQLEIMRRSIIAANGADLLWLGEDLGTQRGPMISLKLFRKHIRPRLQRYVDLGKEFGLLVMIHSCGSSSWAFEDFIEMGVDVVDTLQPEAKDMAPEYLKSTYGGRLAFHGCISTTGPVAFGDVQQTMDDARHILAVMMPGGGYAFAPTHQLQDNSKVENVLALYRLAQEQAWYL